MVLPRQTISFAERQEAGRKLLRMWPFLVLVDAWCFFELYRAMWRGEAYVGPRGHREWHTFADAPFGFSFSVAMDVLGLVIIFILPLIALAAKRDQALPEQHSEEEMPTLVSNKVRVKLIKNRGMWEASAIITVSQKAAKESLLGRATASEIAESLDNRFGIDPTHMSDEDLVRYLENLVEIIKPDFS
jgi:hypothetical protein